MWIKNLNKKHISFLLTYFNCFSFFSKGAYSPPHCGVKDWCWLQLDAAAVVLLVQALHSGRDCTIATGDW